MVKDYGIRVHLSSEDAKEIFDLSVAYDLTVGEVVEQLIKDLVVSDSSVRAWFEGNNMFPASTFVQYLIESGLQKEVCDRLDWIADYEQDGDADEVEHQEQAITAVYEDYCKWVDGNPEPYNQAVESVKKYQDNLRRFLLG